MSNFDMRLNHHKVPALIDMIDGGILHVWDLLHCGLYYVNISNKCTYGLSDFAIFIS